MRNIFQDRTRLVLIFVVFFIALGIYLNTLPGEFVSDDNSEIVNSPWIRDFKYLPEVFVRSLWSFLPDEVYSNFYRPFQPLFFMIGYKISGLNSWGFHLVNITLHALNAVLVFLISVALLVRSACAFNDETPRTNDNRTNRLTLLLGFLGAIIFATNPVNTEAVAWASAVSELSFAFFFLLALYLYIVGYRLPSAIFFLCSMLSKETAMVLPFFLITFDLAVERKNIFPVLPWIKRYALYLVMVFVYAGLRFNAIGGIVPHEADERLLTVYEYILNTVPLLVEFVKTMVAPLELAFFHYRRLDHIHSFFALRNLFFMPLLIVTLYIFYRLRRRKGGVVLFSMLWILLPLMPIIYLGWNQGEPTFAERFLYIPSAGFGLLAALVAQFAVRKARESGKAKEAVIVVLAGFLSLSIVYSVATVRRNFVWNVALTLWQDTLTKAPNNIDARLSVANQLTKRRRFDEALQEYQLIVSVKPDHAGAHNGIGIIYGELGMIEAAIKEFKTAVEISPDYKGALKNLKRAQYIKGRE